MQCADCGESIVRAGEYYMAQDAVWALAGDVEGKLCIGCLEKRIGRRLQPADFTNAPCNFDFPISPRLLHRIWAGVDDEEAILWQQLALSITRRGVRGEVRQHWLDALRRGFEVYAGQLELLLREGEQ